MGWFKRTSTLDLFSPLSMTEEDFVEFPVKDMPNTHLASLVTEVKELISTELQTQVFIAGGFASHLAGVTTDHEDIDVFCVTEQAFLQVGFAIMHMIDRGVDIKPQPGFEVDTVPAGIAIHTRGEGQISKLTYKGLKFDLVNVSKRVGEDTSILGLLRLFDFNWVTVAIDMKRDMIVAHTNASSDMAMPNTNRTNAEAELTIERLKRYKDRLVKPVNKKVYKQLLVWLKNRQSAFVQEQDQQGWY